MDAMMVPAVGETDGRGPHRSFKIKPDFGTLRIGFVEPTIWRTWRKSGRINADAERFMVSGSNNIPCSNARVHGHCSRFLFRGLNVVLGLGADMALASKVRHGGAEHD